MLCVHFSDRSHNSLSPSAAIRSIELSGRSTFRTHFDACLLSVSPTVGMFALTAGIQWENVACIGIRRSRQSSAAKCQIFAAQISGKLLTEHMPLPAQLKPNANAKHERNGHDHNDLFISSFTFRLKLSRISCWNSSGSRLQTRNHFNPAISRLRIRSKCLREHIVNGRQVERKGDDSLALDDPVDGGQPDVHRRVCGVLNGLDGSRQRSLDQ